MSRFVHLHTHSHYSLLNALPKIPELVKKAKSLGMSALALTDNANMYGAIDFYETCKKQEVKPILGVDFYVAIRTRTDKEPRIDNKRTRLVLLAKNVDGYKNLIKLVTKANLEGFYYRPRIDKELIETYKNDLICISPSFSGEIAQALKNGNEELAKEWVRFYTKNFGEDFYIEITYHPEIEGHEENMARLVSFCKTEHVQMVAAHDTYYLEPDDRRARNTLVSIQNEFSERNSSDDTSDFSFISPETAEKYFKHLPEALENCQKIVDKCNLELELGKWLFADYVVPSGLSHDDELRKIVYEGVEKKKIEMTEETKKRIEYELDVIKTKGYAKYFLTVSDLLRFAHEKKILTTIRGSVAGSIVTYLANITNVDPIAYKLPFERFLNPERPSAPDIDMDYADNRRDEVIAYAREKYGSNKVAQIGTFGTMMARGAVRDVARALGFPYSLGDSISKMIPMGSQGFPMTLDHAIEITPELKELYKTDEDAKDIIDMAKKIEGCARHISVHAAGVVISPIPLDEVVPVQFDPKGEGKIITQYDMHAIDENHAGLLKFDFLGIRNLAILADAVVLVKQIENVDVDIENVQVDNKKTFEMLAKGETIGLFQLNGSGMTRFLKELKPSTIHDINAMVALYRPGPMESIPQYIERKHNPDLVQYLDPRMKEILSQSYGVITYQDDVMLIAIHLAGYSWLEADKLRKAMGKKIPAEMEAQKEKLHDGLIANGMSENKVQELWKLIEPFAAYGFNKAHAASYGKVAYQTAYMKANFPAIYMAAVLTAESGDVEKIAEIITECKRMGIAVLPPNINESFEGFTVIKADGNINPETNLETKDEIRFGLTTIKNFGEGIAKAIITERQKSGKFKTLEDFLNRIVDRNLNKKSLESLVKSGAMDEFGERGQLLANTERLLEYNKEQAKTSQGQASLFGAMDQSTTPLRLNEADAIPVEEKLKWEKELLGLFVSGHPLDKYKEKLEARNISISNTKEDFKEGMTTTIVGIIEDVREIRTKKENLMAFIKIADYTSSIECVVFPKTFETLRKLIVVDKLVCIEGKITTRNGTPSVAIEKIKEL